jgi:ribonucleoside-diphosphate reductase beta chain
MALLDGRKTYKPFVYDQAHAYWLKQQNAHWLHTEIAMSPDLQDWRESLSETERNVVGGVLKGFVQTEIVVNDYWTNKVAKWFPHPEVAMMATAFGNMETIHTIAYAQLNDSLGLTDYEAFMQEPAAKAKLDRLIEVPEVPSKKTVDYLEAMIALGVDYPKEIARSLAVFSGFTEGVSLFSSFAALLNFSRFNKLKGVGQIISFSIRDESLHSEAGCWLFREFIKENPQLWTDELKKELYEAARVTVSLEDEFIDKVFELGPVEGLDPKDLKQFIRNRANVKLGDLGLKTNWKNVDQEALKRMDWFDFLSTGVEHGDFFATRVSDYSKGVTDFSTIWDD